MSLTGAVRGRQCRADAAGAAAPAAPACGTAREAGGRTTAGAGGWEAR